TFATPPTSRRRGSPRWGGAEGRGRQVGQDVNVLLFDAPSDLGNQDSSCRNSPHACRARLSTMIPAPTVVLCTSSYFFLCYLSLMHLP
ncbi:unnamed protein product, partial [Musa textilis]